MTELDLSIRSVPIQERSKATLEHILDAAMELLAEVGIEGFNTNALAERADLSVRAIYRYFPNKHAILVMLAERLYEQERYWLRDLADPTSNGAVADFVDTSIERYYEGASQITGIAALRHAIRANRDLRATEDNASRILEKELAAGLATLGLPFTKDEIAAFCRVIIETTTAVMDLALNETEEEGRRLVDAHKLILISALKLYT